MTWSETNYRYVFVVDSRGLVTESLVVDQHKITITPLPTRRDLSATPCL